MKKNKRSLTERLVYNNKFLLVFSVITAILLWGTVKVNYSNDITRVVDEVRVNLSASADEESGYRYFVDEEQLYVDVEITGKAYNINANVISKEDIIVSASEVYADTTGYKVLSLSARFANAATNRNAEIVSVTPSTIAVYYDKEVTQTVNVEGVITNGKQALESEGFIVGNPVASMSTIDVTGPSTVVSQLNKVYFQATVDSEVLPLKESISLPATVKFDFNGVADSHYLSYELPETNPPTVTVTVKTEKVVPTAVKFINEPSDYSADDSNIKIDPENVTILWNTGSADSFERFVVTTVDFRELKNQKNVFTVSASDTANANLLVDDKEEFTVTVDFSSMKSRFISGDQANIVFVNDNKDFDYTVDFTDGSLENICIFGPAASLEKINPEDIQIEINVSGLNLSRSGEQEIEVSNISVQNDDINDCWIYGKYVAKVTATPVS